MSDWSDDARQTATACTAIALVLCSIIGGFIASVQRGYSVEARQAELRGALVEKGISPLAVRCAFALYGSDEACRLLAKEVECKQTKAPGGKP